MQCGVTDPKAWKHLGWLAAWCAGPWIAVVVIMLLVARFMI